MVVLYDNQNTVNGMAQVIVDMKNDYAHIVEQADFDFHL